jgi:hypothetical protein
LGESNNLERTAGLRAGLFNGLSYSKHEGSTVCLEYLLQASRLVKEHDSLSGFRNIETQVTRRSSFFHWSSKSWPLLCIKKPTWMKRGASELRVEKLIGLAARIEDKIIKGGKDG